MHCILLFGRCGMGVVEVPASVPAGGKLGVHLELDREELAETVARLKSAVQAIMG